MAVCTHLFEDDSRNGVAVCRFCCVVIPILNDEAEWREVAAVRKRGKGPVAYHPSNLGFEFPRQFR